jgi:hypothetical protein
MIARIYFGSPAYWYLIADANGVSGSEALTKGVTLTIPDQAANSAQTFKDYNESEVIGSTSPEIHTVANKKKWWQKPIQLLDSFAKFMPLTEYSIQAIIYP